MKKYYFLKYLFLVGLMFALFSCDEEDPVTPPDEGDGFIKQGFMISSFATGDVSTTYAGYFDEMPNGSLDMTSSASSFNFFRARGTHNSFMYGPPTNNVDNGLVKFAVDEETLAIVEIDEFALNGFPSGIVFLDNEQAIVGNFSDREIVIFNPTTMSRTGTIDMSQGVSIGSNINNYYGAIIHNQTLGKIYAVLYSDNPDTPQFYDADSIYVEVIDANTLQWEKTIAHPEAEYPVFRGETNTVIDESGNTYLIAQGTYGLDNAFGPAAPKGSRPQILKINTSSEFEVDYAFNPINALGFENNFFQLFTSMVYAGNNKAYGIGTGTTDDPQILALLQKFATEGLSQQEFGTLVNLVLYGESMKVMEIDLMSKTATEVAGIPTTAGFGYPFMYNYNGKVYTAITAGGNQSFYEIDPNSNAASLVYSITAGGFPYQLIDLSSSAQ